MRVHHVDCGTLCPASSKFITGRGSYLQRARLVCHCLIVETNDGLALVDTGLGTADVERPNDRLGGAFVHVTAPRLDRAQTALARIEKLGFSRKDVRHIVPTHLDLDHVGGLSDFPDATVHVFEPELRAATERKTFAERERYRLAQLAYGPRYQSYSVDGDRWNGLERVRVIGDDIALIPMVGHTRGHSAVAVRDGDRWLVHAGDAYMHVDELDVEHPRCPPGLAFFQRLVAIDYESRCRNVERLRELKRVHGQQVSIFSAHDAAELDSYFR